MSKTKINRIQNGDKDGNLHANREFLDLCMNASMSRKEMLDKLMDPRRDINDECGYPKTHTLKVQDYRDMYDREAIATRVVEVLPKESWQVQPRVFEDEDVDTETEFEKAWDELGKGLRGGSPEDDKQTKKVGNGSWYQQEEGSAVWEYLLRADVLSGIGSYGVLLLGVDDGKDLREPLEPKEGMKLLFLRVFHEGVADITRYETDRRNPRYGQPVNYNLTFNDLDDQTQGGIGAATATENVHWTRIIHIADNLGSSEIFGVPRMQPVFNNLLNLRKLYGGSAEMYWRGAFPGLSIETHPQLGSDVNVDLTRHRDQMENYQNGLQRYLTLMGMTAKSLAPQVVDPTPQIDIQIIAIAIRLGMPMRILMGSERGSLASSQDDDSWNDKLRHRQLHYVTPKIVVAFVDRLISIGVLPEPEGYSVEWPDLDAVTADERAATAMKNTEAMSKYVAGSVESLMAPADYLVRIIGLEQDDVEAILEAVEADMEEKIEQGLLPDPTEEVELDMEGRREGLKQMKEGPPNVGPDGKAKPGNKPPTSKGNFGAKQGK